MCVSSEVSTPRCVVSVPKKLTSRESTCGRALSNAVRTAAKLAVSFSITSSFVSGAFSSEVSCFSARFFNSSPLRPSAISSINWLPYAMCRKSSRNDRTPGAGRHAYFSSGTALASPSACCSISARGNSRSAAAAGAGGASFTSSNSTSNVSSALGGIAPRPSSPYAN